MVKKIFSFLSKEVSDLHEAAYLLAFFTFASQILAIVRDKLLAYHFGAGIELDIYYAAFRIPDLIFVSIGSIVSVSVLLPFITEAYAEGKEKGRKFTDSIFSVFFFSLIITSIIVIIFTNPLLKILLPGLKDSVRFDDLVAMTRILLLSPIFLGISNFISNITQMHKRFLVYALSPIMYNMGIIFGILFLFPKFGLYGLSFGVIIGAFVHMFIQLPFILGRGISPRLTINIDWQQVKKVLLVSLPRTLALSSSQLTSFFLISLASLMSGGAISIFNLALNLQSVPLAIVGVSYSSAIFPALSKYFVDGEKDKFISKVIESGRHIIFWSVPITILFIVLRAQIVRTIFGAGNFDWSDTRLTAAALALFVISVSAQSLILLFMRACYARGKTRMPLLVNVFSSLVIVILAYFLSHIFKSVPVFAYFIEDMFKVSGEIGTIILVLPLSYTIGNIINLVIYWYIYEKDYPGLSRSILPSFYQIFAGSVIMGYVTFISLRFFNVYFPLTKVWGVFLQGFCAGIVGILSLIIILRILNNKELKEVWETLHHKIWKAKVVIPEQDSL